MRAVHCSSLSPESAQVLPDPPPAPALGDSFTGPPGDLAGKRTPGVAQRARDRGSLHLSSQHWLPLGGPLAWVVNCMGRWVTHLPHSGLDAAWFPGHGVPALAPWELAPFHPAEF